MKRFLVFAAALPVLAQGPVIRERMSDKLKLEFAIPPMETFDFLATEAIGGKTVKGAPYSAEAVTEIVQTLADGNRITRKSSSLIYRDGEGRERREQRLRSIGPFEAPGGGKSIISIQDPVAKVSYSLDPERKTARKMALPQMFTFSTKAADGGGKKPEVHVIQEGNVHVEMHAMGGAVAGTRVEGPVGDRLMWVENSGTFTFAEGKNVKRESLGKRMIEGVEAEGTRTTITIEAGAIGNERPIETVNERWYSPELQVVVMTRSSDPRTGETTYKLTQVMRQEPLRNLFEVPADYTVTETKSPLIQLEKLDKLLEEKRQVLKKEREII